MMMYFVRRRLPILLVILAAYVLSLVAGRALNLFYLWWTWLFVLFLGVGFSGLITVENFSNLLRVRRVIREWKRAQRYDDASSTA